MSSIRTILTVGTMILGLAVFHSGAPGQLVQSATTSTQVAGEDSGTFSYAGFVGDKTGDATGSTASPETLIRKAIPTGTTGFVGYLGDEGPSGSALAKGVPKGADEARGVAKAACEGKSCGGDRDPVLGLSLHDPWVTFEYMHAWARGRWLPPLVTTSPPGVDGVLPGSAVRFGDDYIGGRLQASGRVTLGWWLDEQQHLGVGGKFFALEGDSTSFSAASNAAGNPVIARPFFNTDPIINVPDSLIVTGPGLRRGDLLATAENDVLGAEAFVRYSLHRAADRRVDLLAGYHFTRVDDSLDINHRMEQIGGVIPVGTQFTFQDVFDVHNEFHGGELGLLGEVDRGPFTISLMGKLSMGNMRETLTIFGQSSRTPPAGAPTFFTGGLLAMPTNMGTYTRDDFAIIPEVDFKVIYHITERLEASIGYSLVYWSDVALAGQQVDLSRGQPTVNAAQLLGGAIPPGDPLNPAFTGIFDTDFWVQALSIGLTFKL